MATKKRTGLDALGLESSISSIDKGAKDKKNAGGSRRSAKAASPAAAQKIASPIEKSEKTVKPKDNWKEKGSIKSTTVYVPEVVYEQWRELAFTERKKMHDYLIEGLERVFEDRGLKSIDELTGRE